ncbi:CatB-related O-acetyltransferase [Sediminicola luteus]|uniref:Chloramphenicol acetyltransferase n=1 Tax=Sediminicola luteus TaxID=319238 RepID=A0A2A4GEU5_9FLAO|nr:CatB-related O-acetyltransferase [Sediminicola luteus]PCE66315.1 chloramphenicol acetyltransferase [Sediminicola luteus]
MPYPDPNTTFPLPGYDKLCFLKNIIKNPNIIVGDYTYYDDFEDVGNFEKNVKYHFDFIGDKLIIGKFCQIASGVRFIMNGGNHLTESPSAYPFAIFGKDWAGAMAGKSYPTKGDTQVGHDVWIGHEATIIPGVRIGHGAIIAAKSVVTKDVAPYTVVGGNPAKPLKKRFSEAKIAQLLHTAWWDWPLDKITQELPWLTDVGFGER